MSRKQFTSHGGCFIAELDFNELRVSGVGGADYPFLSWQLEMTLQRPKSHLADYAFRSATAQLYFKNGERIADARLVPLQRSLHGPITHSLTEYLHLEFPLDVRRIEAIERRRDGGPLDLRLDVQVQFDEFGLLSARPELRCPDVWGLKDAHVMRLQESVQIPQSHWTTRVLPHVGYGTVHVIEFPAVPPEAYATMEHSFKALKQAEEKHRLGFYDDAAGKCRTAIEPFFESESVDPSHPESRKVPVLKKHWEVKIGKATYEWLKLTLGSIKDAGNPPHHSPNEHYSQLDSQMILAITTGVVAYIARTIGPDAA